MNLRIITRGWKDQKKKRTYSGQAKNRELVDLKYNY